MAVFPAIHFSDFAVLYFGNFSGIRFQTVPEQRDRGVGWVAACSGIGTADERHRQQTDQQASRKAALTSPYVGI
jgi:hypothetical protein